MKKILAIVLIIFSVSFIYNRNIDLTVQNVQLDTNQVVESARFSLIPAILIKKYDIYLANKLITQKQMQDIAQIANSAGKLDEIVLHIAGVGGNVEIVYRLVNTLNNSKAKVRAIVEAPSYSGHALLALSIRDLTILPNAYLMLHTVSGYGFVCSPELKLQIDRGQTAYESCMNIVNALTQQANLFIDSLNYITVNEKQSIKNGYEVYIFADELHKRGVKSN